MNVLEREYAQADRFPHVKVGAWVFERVCSVTWKRGHRLVNPHYCRDCGKFRRGVITGFQALIGGESVVGVRWMVPVVAPEVEYRKLRELFVEVIPAAPLGYK